MLNHETTLDLNTHYMGIYLGVVEDNVDPLNQGRVKVRILGFHSDKITFDGVEGIATSELPWAVPATPIQGGGVSGLGWSGVPVAGSHVCLFFIGGDHNFPVYFAAIQSIYKTQPDTKKGFCDPNGTYPKALNTPDFNALASPTKTVFETPDDGVRVEYDSTDGAETYRVTLKKTGATITLSQDNKITIAGDSSTVIGISGGTINVVGNTIVNLGGTSGTTPFMLDSIISKLNDHTHSYSPGPSPTAQTGTMAISLPSSELKAADSTTKVKAK